MYLLLFLFVLFVPVKAQTCSVPLIADTVPTNPGIASIPTPSTYGVFAPKGYSEVISLKTMSLSTPTWQRVNCPHLQSGLTSFTSLLTPYTAGMDVTIPVNVSVLYSASALVSYPVFRTIQVYGTLIFNDENTNLAVAEIRVWSTGHLAIGSDTCRLFGKVNITFTGSAATSTQKNFDPTLTPSKGIMASGKVDVHGKEYSPTWTRLSRTLASGKTVIFVQDLVNWEVGQLVLITTSAWYDCPANFQATYCQNRPHQNEIRSIVGLAQTGGEQAIQLNQSLTYSHYAGTDYQVEVALLSRRINFAGVLVCLSGSGNTCVSDNFGGHTLVTGNGYARFSGVRGDRMGQLNVLGRYPFHFHHIADGSQSYFQDCVVTNSFFRAYTVHGTNSSRVSRNIAYGVLGHAFYIEDGVEENNLFDYNLAAQVTPLGQPAQGGWSGDAFIISENATSANRGSVIALLNPADVSAAGFYISNAYNSFIGNVAVGGASGFVFPNLPFPVFTSNVTSTGLLNDLGNNNPQNRPLLLFDANTVHSSGFYWPEQGPGIYIGAKLYYENGILKYNPGRNARTTKTSDGWILNMTFTNTKVFLVNRGVVHWGSNSYHENFEAYNIGYSAAFLFGTSAIHNALIAGYSGNTYNSYYLPNLANCGTRVGFQFYDTSTPIILTSVTFRNFGGTSGQKTGCSKIDNVLTFLGGGDHYLPQVISATAGIKFENIGSSYKIKIDSCGTPCAAVLYMQSLLDYDGTVAGTVGNPAIITGLGPIWKIGTGVTCSSCQNTFTTQWYSNRHAGYVKLANAAGFFNACDARICSTAGCCDDQTGRYTPGYMSLWGSKASSTKQDLSPWSAISAPLNTGIYLRIKPVADFGYTLTTAGSLQGPPKLWSIQYINVPPGNFFVFAMAYPPTAQINVTLRKNNVIYLDYPKATSLAQIRTNTEPLRTADQIVCTPPANATDDYCEDTGATGPLWYFDGTHVYVRVVNVMCYLYASYQTCQDLYKIESHQAKLWATANILGIYIEIKDCPGCTEVIGPNGGLMYTNVADVVPSSDFVMYNGNTVAVTPTYLTSKTVTGTPGPVVCSTGPILANYPNAVLGSCVSSSAALGTTCTLGCANGYFARGTMSVSCQSSGLWSSFVSGSGCFITCA